MDWQSIGRMIMGLGLMLLIIGVIIYAGGRFINLGGLPGDLVWKRGNVTFYFPVVSSILVSLILTLLLNLIFRR